MRQGLIDAVEQVIKDEQTASMEKFPLFNSPHEGYAVILEELDELKTEVYLLEAQVAGLWRDVKTNCAFDVNDAEAVEREAISAACEAIQVAAMARKYQESMGEVRG